MYISYLRNHHFNQTVSFKMLNAGKNRVQIWYKTEPCVFCCSVYTECTTGLQDLLLALHLQTWVWREQHTNGCSASCECRRAQLYPRYAVCPDHYHPQVTLQMMWVFPVFHSSELWEHWRTSRRNFWWKVMIHFLNKKVFCKRASVCNCSFFCTQWGEHTSGYWWPWWKNIFEGAAPSHYARLSTACVWSATFALQTLQPETRSAHGFQTGM